MRNSKPSIMSIVGPLILAVMLLVGIAFDSSAAGPLGAIAAFFIFGAVFNGVRLAQFKDREDEEARKLAAQLAGMPPLSTLAQSIRQELLRFDSMLPSQRREAIARLRLLSDLEVWQVVSTLPEPQKQQVTSMLKAAIAAGK